jgi:ABC-type lipoprotein release transport system permease subunit
MLVGRGLEAMLYETSPYDPVMLGTIAATLLITAMVACAVPALRATQVDPATALRTD